MSRFKPMNMLVLVRYRKIKLFLSCHETFFIFIRILKVLRVFFQKKIKIKFFNYVEYQK